MYSYFTFDVSQVVIMGSSGLGALPFISHTKYDHNSIGISPLNTIMDKRKFFYFLIRKYWSCICLIEMSSYFIAWLSANAINTINIRTLARATGLVKSFQFQLYCWKLLKDIHFLRPGL